MLRKKDTEIMAEKIAFIIYGNLDSPDFIKDRVINWLGRNSIGASLNADLDVFFSPKKNSHESFSLDNPTVKNDAFMISYEISAAVNDFKQNLNQEDYSFAILVNAMFFNTPDTTKTDAVVDLSLPKNYLYLAYDEKIDFGYSIDWIWGSPALISKMADFNNVVVTSMHGNNDFIKKFTITGWPATVSSSNLSILIRNLRINIISCLQYVVVKMMELNTGEYAIAKLQGLKRLIRYELLQSERVAEIHCQQENPTSHLTYQKYLAGKVRPAVKYFILESNLRDRIRFLSLDDFNSNVPLND